MKHTKHNMKRAPTSEVNFILYQQIIALHENINESSRIKINQKSLIYCNVALQKGLNICN